MRCVSLAVNADCLILLHCSVTYFIWFAKCSWCHRWEGAKPYYDIENMPPGSDFRQVCRARCSDGSRDLGRKTQTGGAKRLFITVTNVIMESMIGS